MAAGRLNGLWDVKSFKWAILASVELNFFAQMSRMKTQKIIVEPTLYVVLKSAEHNLTLLNKNLLDF
jgi:hypothetical protein